MAGNANSGDKTKHEKFWFNVLTQKGANWAIRNWHKFSDITKERIFLACMNKAIPSKTENDNKNAGPETKIIIVNPPGYIPKEQRVRPSVRNETVSS